MLKTHPLNVSYLVVGLVFLGVSGSWALQAGGAVDSGDTHWMIPAVLLLAGVVGLVAVAAKGLSRGRSADDVPAYDAYPTTYDSDLGPAYDEPTEATTRLDTDPENHTDSEGESR
ncbi:hypothetical protein KRR39_15235 [Nocardioides panacis]|uniref:Uncharacterized protein n=1 Tax=Nocardioides panacis TaxID=2849501 RepID=A0A975SW23_9ACTN|nr:hypothetical protein [Nocardioides panacis]QWZ06867.1 hypothetical protein KRR39_15235 [Nocardioides panacis]